MVQQQVAKKEGIEFYTNPRLKELAVDADAYKKNAIDYVNMYISVYELDKAGYRSISEIPKFRIRDLIRELEKLSRKERDVLNKFFGITGVRNYLKRIRDNDTALRNMAIDASDAATKLRTAEKMYQYNKRFREAVDGTASKVHDPEGKYTNLDKAKFAHIYFWFIKDFQYMPYDEPRKNDVMIDIEQDTEKEQFPAIESYVAQWERFFSKFPDGDIVIPQIIEFIWEADEQWDDLMVRFAGLAKTPGIKGQHGSFTKKEMYEDKIKCMAIREAKESLFPHGEWNGDYFSLSGFAKMPEETVKALIESYNNYKTVYEYEPSKCKKVVRWHAVFRTQGNVKVQFPRYAEKRNFVDEIEMIFFLGMLEYIEKYVPQFKFHDRPFIEYGFGKMIA